MKYLLSIFMLIPFFCFSQQTDTVYIETNNFSYTDIEDFQDFALPVEFELLNHELLIDLQFDAPCFGCHLLKSPNVLAIHPEGTGTYHFNLLYTQENDDSIRYLITINHEQRLENSIVKYNHQLLDEGTTYSNPYENKFCYEINDYYTSVYEINNTSTWQVSVNQSEFCIDFALFNSAYGTYTFSYLTIENEIRKLVINYFIQITEGFCTATDDYEDPPHIPPNNPTTSISSPIQETQINFNTSTKRLTTNGVGEINIFSINGRLLNSFDNQKEIDLSHLKSGYHIAHFNNEEIVKTMKFMVF